MITLPLRMQYSPSPVRPAAAWLIPGDDAADWLDELLQWGIPLAAVTLYPVPGVRGDTAPAGILAVVGKAAQPAVSRRCQPYGRIDGRGAAADSGSGVVYLPVEARIDPDATESELAALLTRQSGVHLLHPAVGLVRFLESDAYRVADLLRPAPVSEGQWDAAEPGVTLSQRLWSIEPISVPSVQMVLSEGRDEIGSQPLTGGQLPRSPEEPADNALAAAGRAVMRQIARLASWFGSRAAAPVGSAKPGGLAQWAQQKMKQLDQALLASRHSELLRLLHLLETDPEQGLRYALPLHSGDHRGIAPPSDRLTYRDIDFDLQRMRGGQPADPWDVPFDFQTRLLRMYHELATREIQLGRHRRAAYIYAELLGDLRMAAATLKAGRHFREAAVLYRQRLAQPEEAARCLEEGGLWIEAIGLYEELGEFEKVGDLYSQLEQPDPAREAYGRAVSKHRRDHDYLTAAKILETKLDDCDGAAECLDAGWPASRQASQCLEALFQLLGRHGRHKAASDKVAELRRQPPSDASLSLLESLSRFARSYPDRDVQAQAADATRTLAAGCLRVVSPLKRLAVLAAVRQLVPDDRLLARDCQRFSLIPPAPPPTPPVPRSSRRQPSQLKRRSTALTLVRTIQLPENVQWCSAMSAEHVFYAAGYGDNELVVVQGFWNGDVRQPSGSPWHYAATRQPPVLLACGGDRQPVLMRQLPPGLDLPWRRFPPTDALPFSIKVGTPPWLSARAVAVQSTAGGQAHVLARGPIGLTLSSYSSADELLGSRSLAWSEIWPDGDGTYDFPTLHSVPFHVRDDVCLGLEDRLILWRPPARTKVVDVGGTIRGLHRSARHSRSRVAVALERGALLYWDESQEHVAPFAEDLDEPVLRFVGGWVVVAAVHQCRVYRTAENHQIHLEASVAHEQARPIAVLPTDQNDRFAVVAQDGIVAIYQANER